MRSLLKEHRLEPRQIAIIGPASKAKGPLAAVNAIDGVPLIDDASAWREGKGILCSTARSFKGLEADVVILCDFSGLGTLFTVSDLYVALTRARSHLVIVAHDRVAKESLNVALAAAIADGCRRMTTAVAWSDAIGFDTDENGAPAITTLVAHIRAAVAEAGFVSRGRITSG